MNRRRNFALPVFELRPRVYAVTVRGMLCRALTYPHTPSRACVCARQGVSVALCSPVCEKKHREGSYLECGGNGGPRRQRTSPYSGGHLPLEYRTRVEKNGVAWSS